MGTSAVTKNIHLHPGAGESGMRAVPMRKKIQSTMIMVIVATLTVAYAITILFVYARMRSVAENDIRVEADYIRAATDLGGEQYLRQLDIVEPQTRVTLIDTDGTVLYDSVQDEFTLENHLSRPEVQAALKDGTGQDVRESNTLGEEMFYCAERLNDGKVVRVAKSVATASRTALQLLPVILGIGALMLAFAVWISRRQAEALVRPINTLNLDDPLKNDVYEELSPLLHRIDEQNKMKDAMANMRKEFSANVSHELKTPLTSISGYAEIIRDGIVKPADIPQFSDRIYKEANRLVTLINDIIKLSKLDEGEVHEQMADVDLFDLTREIVSRLGQKARDCQVHVEMSGETCTVKGIRQILDEMIYNIIENAIKYNKKGGLVEIWVGEDMSGKKVVVSDTGIGIPHDQLDRIFERFYRVDKSHSKETGGTGLGLSIVKHGAIIHHARIDVDSELGVGTRMTIAFPKEAVVPEKEKTNTPVDSTADQKKA